MVQRIYILREVMCMPLDTSDLKTDEIFLKLVYENINEKGLIDGYVFDICLVADEEIVGSCDLRIGYIGNLYLRGNIGYKVHEQYRGNHYAGKACPLLFGLARSHGMEYLYISCNPDNYASRKTCEYAGGVLEAIVDIPADNSLYLEGDRQKCIYRVNL